MKNNRKSNINIDLKMNESNRQNNQKKEILNQNVKTNKNFSSRKSFKDLSIIKMYKRSMFTKGNNSIVLKKSSEIIINKPLKSEIIFNSPINSQRTTLDTVIIPTLKNRNMSLYTGLKKNNYVINNDKVKNKADDIIYTFILNEQKKVKIDESYFLLKEKLISEEQQLVLIKRLGALNLSYVHTVVLDIISQDDLYISYMYYVITTSNKIVDYGGVNKYKPIFLCKDEAKNKEFYTIPLIYLRKQSREDFLNVFKYKEKSEFKDAIELQKKITESLMKIEKEYGDFRQLDVDKECLNIDIRKIDPNEMFPKKESYYRITEWEEYIVK